MQDAVQIDVVSGYFVACIFEGVTYHEHEANEVVKNSLLPPR